MTRDQLRRLPVFLLNKLYDTAGVSAYGSFMARQEVLAKLDEPQALLIEPGLLDERDRLDAEIDRLTTWQREIDSVRYERRPALVRVLVDDPLDPTAPSI